MRDVSMHNRRSEIVRFGAAARGVSHGPLAGLDFDERLMESELMEGFIPPDLFKAVCHLVVAILAGLFGEPLIERVHLKRLSGDGVGPILFAASDKRQQLCLFRSEERRVGKE